MFMVSAVSVEVFPFIFLLSDVSALTLMLVGAQHSTIFIIWLIFCLQLRFYFLLESFCEKLIFFILLRVMTTGLSFR